MPGDEVDIDAERAGFVDYPPHDRPAVGDVPPAVLDGSDHDLGYLVLPREVDQSSGRIVVFHLVPAGAEVGDQLSRPVDRPAVPGRLVSILAVPSMVQRAAGAQALAGGLPGTAGMCPFWGIASR